MFCNLVLSGRLKLENEISRLQRELNSVYNSKSWMLTSPVRALSKSIFGDWNSTRRKIIRRILQRRNNATINAIPLRLHSAPAIEAIVSQRFGTTKFTVVDERHNFSAPSFCREMLFLKSEIGQNTAGHDIEPITTIFSSYPAPISGDITRIEWLTQNYDLAVDWFMRALSGMEVMSCDVFDTVMLRHNESEAERNFHICEYIVQTLRDTAIGAPLKHVDAEALLLMRASAMNLTYGARPAVQGCREGSIKDVVTNIALTIGGGSELASRMLECELDYEATHCLFSNAPLIEAMCRFKRLGGKVLLVSDMYLHQEHIRVLLSKVAPNSLPHIDNIYSSADTVISKRSGLLFPRLAQMGAFPPCATLHIGDSFSSDIQKAREAGMNALYLPIFRHELRMRQASLARMIQTFDRVGVDIRTWAKV
ncbi:HAD superfamily hydrolase-like protein (plasmid) [Acetobacter ghanensis]|uniref:HAD superfamily hydrolase-like protein n=2 Tax=Acetobacter ghanensis TaxID=431306 RepID=A0A0U5FCY8_9PROT|nr:HAD superfamily hydrolase-like protein [Acetobacter ghanensis]